MNIIKNTPWKVKNEIERLICFLPVRMLCRYNGIPWGNRWSFYGVPIIQKHHSSAMRFGDGLSLRSSVRSNPLGPNHAVILCTWLEGAEIVIGDEFGMTGGSLVAAHKIIIGNRVTVGANTIIMDTDFHPIDPEKRRLHPQEAITAPVIIDDDVFIGMNCLILKGVTLGQGCVVGAGSVVTHDVNPSMVAAGNPAKVIGLVNKRQS